MKTEIEFNISIDSQTSIFKDHLDNYQNERVIFSGIFGIGKSYFLEKFFKNQLDEYLTISLSPVNYSVSNNEDIFNLIKYDILYELIANHKLELETEIISRHIAYGTIISSKAGSFLETFLNVAPQLNKGLGNIEELPSPAPFVRFLKNIIPQINKIEAERQDANLNNRVLNYIKDLEQSVLFENDFITGFIIESLNKLAASNGSRKQKVLIIDDLDRIDPEHIFRLFNIFSSHLRYGKLSTNKFGFDKVIFVCDIENIRNIFSARYGANVDFSGYIDKFYSTEIYYFDNTAEVSKATEEILKSIDFGEYKNFIEDQLLNDRYRGLLTYLLSKLISSGSLSMRRLSIIYGSRYNFKERKLNLPSLRQEVENWNLSAVVALEILFWIFGSTDSLEKALIKAIKFERSRASDRGRDYNEEIRILGHFIALLDYRNNQFETENEYGTTLNKGQKQYKFEDLTVDYKLIKSGPRSNRFYGYISDDSTGISNRTIEVVYQTFKLLKDIQYFAM